MALTPKIRKHIRALRQALNKVEAQANRWPEGRARDSAMAHLEMNRLVIERAEKGLDFAISSVQTMPIPKVIGSNIVWNMKAGEFTSG
jgi:hypothetical protein